MTIRIIAGTMRGRRLQTLPGDATRPLLGQVREALFNILGQRFDGVEVWDLFAGTGASGIEALSRGAGRVLFLEKGGAALAVLRTNIATLGVEERSRVLRVDAWQPPPLRPDAEAAEVPPHLVFFDPPYADVRADPGVAVRRAIDLTTRLAPGGVLCFHYPRGVIAAGDFAAASECQLDVRTWGTSTVALLERSASAG